MSRHAKRRQARRRAAPRGRHTPPPAPTAQQHTAAMTLSSDHDGATVRTTRTEADGTLHVDVFGDLGGAMTVLTSWLGSYRIAPDGSVTATAGMHAIDPDAPQHYTTFEA